MGSAKAASEKAAATPDSRTGPDAAFECLSRCLLHAKPLTCVRAEEAYLHILPASPLR